MALSDYKELVGWLASHATVAQVLSGTVMCRTFAQRGTTLGTPPAVFVLPSVLAVLMLEAAHVMRDDATLRASRAILVLHAGHLACYWFFCHDRPALYRSLAKLTVLAAAVLYYARRENRNVLQPRLGVILTVLYLSLVAHPLFSLRKIIKTENSACIPLPMVVSRIGVAFLWLLYGEIIENSSLIFENAIVLTLSVVQLSLVIIYPRTLPA